MKFRKKKDIKTLVKLRFGNFELRLSKAKVEIEDVVYKTAKYTYSNISYEYGLISFLLKKQKPGDGGKSISKTDDEINQGIDYVGFLLNMLAYTNLIFSNEVFREEYFKLVTSAVAKPKLVDVSEEEDKKTLNEMQTEHEMSESV